MYKKYNYLILFIDHADNDRTTIGPYASSKDARRAFMALKRQYEAVGAEYIKSGSGRFYSTAKKGLGRDGTGITIRMVPLDGQWLTV